MECGDITTLRLMREPYCRLGSRKLRGSGGNWPEPRQNRIRSPPGMDLTCSRGGIGETLNGEPR